jgi:hypothetical protein
MATHPDDIRTKYPEFTRPNFQPDPAASYALIGIALTGCNYLQILVLGGEDRVNAELAPFIRDHSEEAKQQAQHQNLVGYTALLYAASLYGSISAVLQLIPLSDATIASKVQKITALHKLATHCIDENAMRSLIQVSDVNQQCTMTTPLVYAISYNKSYQIVKMLIDCTDINVVFANQVTTLQWAIRVSHNIRVIEYLVSRTSASVIKNHTTNIGSTHLITAVCRYIKDRVNLSAVQLLIPYSNVGHSKTNTGNSALMYACSAYRASDPYMLECIELLLAHSSPNEIQLAVSLAPSPLQLFAQITARAYARLAERSTLSAALKEGIGLPGALALTYL